MKKRYIISIGVAIAVIALFILSFSFYEVEKREALQTCEFEIADVRIRSIGFTSADIEIVFDVSNPNEITATLDRADYRIYGNDVYLGEGVITERTDIQPLTTKRIITPFTFEYVGVGEVIRDALMEGEVKWKIEGVAHIDTPFGSQTISFSRYV